MGDGERVNLRKKVTEVLGGWRWARSGRSKAESLEESSVSWCDNQSKVWVESAFEREPLKHKLGREAMHFAVYPPERVQALRPRFDHMLH